MTKRWDKLEKYSSWRKIAPGMWGAPNDPTIYGKETVDISRLVAYLDAVSRASGQKVTLTAYCVKLMATIFERFPDLNVIMVGNSVRRRRSIDIFCQVALPNKSAGQADLSGVKLADADQLDVVEIARKLGSRASDVRAGRDAEMEKTKSLVDYVPARLMGPVVSLIDFLTFEVPADLDSLGVRSDPFGSAMVTSVGQFDIYQGFAPLVPASRCPLVCLPGKIHRAPFVVDDEVVVRDAVTMSCTFDHRCYDGYQIGYVVRTMRSLLMYPERHYPAPEAFARSDAEAAAHLADAIDPEPAAPVPRPEDAGSGIG